MSACGQDQENKREMELTAVALQRGWVIPEDLKDTVIQTCRDMVEGAGTSREKIAAMKVLALVDGINARREGNAIRAAAAAAGSTPHTVNIVTQINEYEALFSTAEVVRPNLTDGKGEEEKELLVEQGVEVEEPSPPPPISPSTIS